MIGTIQNLAVRIARFVDDNFPGWVECEFVDAEGHQHTIIDKVPTFTTAPLDSNSKYPQGGHIYCTVLTRWTDDYGKDLVRVTTAHPFPVESTAGLTEFVVPAGELTDLTNEEIKWVAGTQR
jgi:hypothetical protein